MVDFEQVIVGWEIYLWNLNITTKAHDVALTFLNISDSLDSYRNSSKRWYVGKVFC